MKDEKSYIIFRKSDYHTEQSFDDKIKVQYLKSLVDGTDDMFARLINIRRHEK